MSDTRGPRPTPERGEDKQRAWDPAQLQELIERGTEIHRQVSASFEPVVRVGEQDVKVRLR